MGGPKDVGERSEGQILAAFLKAGKVVLMPFGDNQRYDLVLDEGGSFKRIQCKTGHVKNGVIIFNTCSTHHHRGKGWRDYRGEADFFAVFVPDLDRFYLIPVEEVPTQKAHLRLDPPKNGQTQGVRLASMFEFKPS